VTDKKPSEKMISVAQHMAEVMQIKAMGFDELLHANQSSRALQKNEQAQRQLLGHVCEALECDVGQLLSVIASLKKVQ
jgi:DNA-binding Xre family transcriptional regulator